MSDKENLKSNQKLKIAYQNIHGFGSKPDNYSKTILYIKNIIQTTDLFILSETWFLHHTKYIMDPNFVISTPRPSYRKGFKFNNGIAIFAKQEIQLQIKILIASRFYAKN